MFSGIVQQTGSVVSFERNGEGGRLVLGAALFSNCPIALGASICVSGVCLTVAESSNDQACFDLCTETLRCTTMGQLKIAGVVNLEQALRAGDSLDGHIVQGHVDAVSTLLASLEIDNTVRLEFSLLPSFSRFIVPKGSVAIDGVSLTVGEVGEKSFSVYVIPHTLKSTTFRTLAVGSEVNIEADCLAKYLARLVEPYLPATNQPNFGQPNFGQPNLGLPNPGAIK